jgi:hypothetical protein
MNLLAAVAQNFIDSDDDEDALAAQTVTGNARFAGEAAARNMSEKRLVKGTKDGYKSKIKIMTQWFKDNEYFDLFSDDMDSLGQENLRIPKDTNAVITFLGYIGQKGLHRNENDEILDENGSVIQDASFEGQVTKAVSTMGGYRSAIMDLYKKNKQTPQQELVVEMANFMGGFKRTVSDLKLKGHMKLEEGRSAIPFTGYIALAKII